MVIDGVNGYLFEASNVKELRHKVTLLDDDAVVQKMGIASRKRLEDHFSPSTHYKNLVKVFNSVKK